MSDVFQDRWLAWIAADQPWEASFQEGGQAWFHQGVNSVDVLLEGTDKSQNSELISEIT